ncbi:CIC11C00000000901 [Sungouiella intermedia]|uniref:CIC11C00000000901 n=1 Tax=Sungouiella intermedia TaxID=45354 RepID=A0A1L0D1H3_9ASCO|nr:CIC11C00000000901 [[Candida] intermedia]
MSLLLKDIVGEVHGNTAMGIHPTVLALVDAFLSYLREPRYQNPLSLAELANLFQSFYADLDSLVINIYTQLNTNKRHLLQKSGIFNSDPDTFDYLVAIANYSLSSIKLVKRTDPAAMKQLRVFAYYKMLTILDTVEKAQYDLFSSGNPGDKSSLYDKIFRFDERDIRVQRLFSEKIRVLRHLNLNFSSFCDITDTEEKVKLDEFFLTFHIDQNPTLEKIQSSLRLMNQVRTPSAKLKHIVKTQKLVIILLSAFYDHDTSKVNNDILLPALIYIIINHLPESDSSPQENLHLKLEAEYDFYLNFTFVKNFLNLIDPYNVDCSLFTLSSSLLSYNPTEKKRSFPRSDRKTSSNLYELLNLTESPATGNTEEVSTLPLRELEDDQSLISHIQSTYLNNGEHQYYLTNFEAILYFLLNTPIKELIPDDFTIPESYKESIHFNMNLQEIIECSDKRRAQLLPEKPLDDDISKMMQEEMDGSRARSSSLFNTITSAVSQSVNRSRSNSALKSPTKEESNDFEASLTASPFAGDLVDHYGLAKVRNILGRLGLVSTIQMRPPPLDEEAESIITNTDDLGPEFGDARAKRSLSFFDKLSPNHSRTRSGSLENAAGMMSNNSALRRSTLTSKFSSGVTELMTKLSTATTTGPSSANLIPASATVGHTSNLSLHSIEEPSPFEDHSKRPSFSKRSASLQTMERWFNNIPEATTEANHQPTSSNASNQYTTGESNYNEGSVFSASFGELTRYQHIDFESLTINDLKTLKGYYDQLCSEVMSTKSGSKTSNEFLPEDDKGQTSL